MKELNAREVQLGELSILKKMAQICEDLGLRYFLMYGTLLGAIRHQGFIPWDDDLDIFMTPDQYERFKEAFEREAGGSFVLQEWRSVPDYLEYAKVRMNGTTFIEPQFRDRRDLHQGIYVDIMILHKVPENKLIQRLVYYESKYVTLYGISQRGWKPKNRKHALALCLLKVLPNRWLASKCYQRIYRYRNLETGFYWCYWITKASFRGGLFEEQYFSKPTDIHFEDTKLMGSHYIREYLAARYGDYMKLPSEAEQKAAVHAEIFDTEIDFREYMR